MTIPITRTNPLLNWRLWAFPTALSAILIGVAQYSFLSFHTFAELFAIIISFLIFAFAWSTRNFSRNNFLLFLACGYFWVGSLDLMHMLTYKGMDVFVEGSGNLSVQFWIGTRYLEAFMLLAAPLIATRKLNTGFLFVIFGVIAAGLTVCVLSGQFPVGFVEGTGLTDFKIYSEYLIIIMLALALFVLRRHRQDTRDNQTILIAAAIVLTMCAELAFTLYIDVYGLSNLTGHIFKLFSFWLIFQAIIISHLTEPYAALKKSERQSRSLFENTEVSIWNEDLSSVYEALEDLRARGVSDLRAHLSEHRPVALEIAGMLKVLQVNHATITLFGAKDEADFLARIDTTYGPHALDVFIDELCAIWDGHSVFHSEASLKTFAGEPIDCIVTFQIPDTKEGFRSIPVSIVDITDRKRIERQLLEARDEAEAASTAKSEFLSSMSHELRTPLNAILGFAQILKSSSSETLSPNQIEKVNYIADGGNHLLRLVNQVLDLSKVEADEIDLCLENVAINEIIANAIILVSPLAETQKVTIRNELAGTDQISLYTDQTRAKQVFINLLSNALKFSNEGGIVTVKGQEIAGNSLRITVEDTGIGIPAAKHDRVFRMFDRLDIASTMTIEGAGIGLLVTKILVEKMGGAIEFESKEGKGSTFWVDLPMSPRE